MVLVAVARPRYDHHRKMMFDGRIGMWPFVEIVPALRNSKNRPAGAPILRGITVDRDTYRRYLVDHVIPAIKEKWPGSKRQPIYIQQDNAKPHVLLEDAVVAAAGRADGWRISMSAQPPNSPDCNVLDLGFFASIQALQHKKRAATVEELLRNVREAFDDLHFTKLDRVFMTLQLVLGEILANGGSNRFKIPHKQKNTLVGRNGLLPTVVACDLDALANTKSAIVAATPDFAGLEAVV